jgi:hypothetical protein
MKLRSLVMILAGLAFASGQGAAFAETISNPVAELAGLDKITARITDFDVYMNETVQFGSLQITPKACYTKPPSETQHTWVFLDIDQVSLKGTIKRIFTGFMSAESPALNAIDNPVYDIWLVDCKQSSSVPPPDQRNGTQQRSVKPDSGTKEGAASQPGAPSGQGN